MLLAEISCVLPFGLLNNNAPVVAICDHYGAFLRRTGRSAPEATKYENYKDLLADENVSITRLARGIAAGSVLEFANKDMLADALRGRREF